MKYSADQDINIGCFTFIFIGIPITFGIISLLATQGYSEVYYTVGAAMFGLFTTRLITSRIIKYLKFRNVSDETIEKTKYLNDKFKALKNTIDKEWEMEITNIIIKPPSKGEDWIVTKIMTSNNRFNPTVTEEEIFRKSDKALGREINKTEESTP